MDKKDFKDIFDNFDINQIKKSEDYCIDGTCESEEEVDLKDYPSYTEALYAKIIAPAVSGIYISRWDIKDIALDAGDSMAIHPRKRMFELLMKYATSKENMQSVLDSLEQHIEEKIAIYEQFIKDFPATKEIFEPQIAKAKKTVKFFPKIIEEYFQE